VVGGCYTASALPWFAKTGRQRPGPRLDLPPDAPNKHNMPIQTTPQVVGRCHPPDANHWSHQPTPPGCSGRAGGNQLVRKDSIWPFYTTAATAQSSTGRSGLRSRHGQQELTLQFSPPETCLQRNAQANVRRPDHPSRVCLARHRPLARLGPSRGRKKP